MGWTIRVLLAAVLLSTAALADDQPALKPGSDGWTVIFRSDNSLIWNSDAGEASAKNGFAVRLDKVPHDIGFLRLRRMDIKSAVIVAIDPDQVGKTVALEEDLVWDGGAAKRGQPGYWNRLLGIARPSWEATQKGAELVSRIPGKTDQGYGGWGFSKLTGAHPRQTYSWENKPIDQTIFEIAVKPGPLTPDEMAMNLSSDQTAPDTHEKLAAAATTQIAKLQTTIKALYVREMPSGQMLGLASDLILTATRGPERAQVPVTFATTAGSQMHMVLDDVLRAVRLRYPRWDATKVELSFEDKYTPKDGGSIGAAIGTLILSMIHGFDIDPKLAITGDVTADGKVRHIGGVAAKLRGATEAGCELMALPTDNYDQLSDAFVYDGAGSVTGIQVIGIANLDDAMAVARVDRADNLTAAISQFAEVQAVVKKQPGKVHAAETKDKLQHILELAPNHFSAKLLLQLANNQEPKKLSSAASMYYAWVAVGNMSPALFGREDVAGNASFAAPAVVQQGLKDLQEDRQLADPAVVPFLDALRQFVEAESYGGPKNAAQQQELQRRQQAVVDEMAKLQSDRDLMEKMMREGV